MTRSFRFRLGLAGTLATVALAVVAVFAPAAAAAGWLVAFATVGAVVLGAVALLLIHGLTGGRWGWEQRPAFVAAAAATPLLVVAFAVLLLAAPLIYPWVDQPGRAGSGVAHLYLNQLFFGLRGAAVIAGLALFAWLDRRRGLTALAAGIGLTWYCIGLDFVAVDWLQSIEPRYTSSAFGAQIIIEQLMAALAWVILATPGTDDDGQWNDLGSLLLATTLGESYLILITLVVDWYGDQPHQAAWYERRTAHGWIWLEVTGFLVGSAGPLVALLFAAVRRKARPLKLVALCALGGVLSENIWLVAPATSAWALLTGPLACLALGALLAGFAPRPIDRRARPQEVAHGVRGD